MYQTVLVHANIDECAERSHVADSALEHHAGFEVSHGFHAFIETSHCECRSRITTGFFDFFQNVAHGDHSNAVVGK